MPYYAKVKQLVLRRPLEPKECMGVRAVQGIKENMPVVRMLKRVHGIENLEAEIFAA